MSYQSEIEAKFAEIVSNPAGVADVFKGMTSENLSEMLYASFRGDENVSPVAQGEGILEGDVAGPLILDKKVAAELVAQVDAAGTSQPYVYSLAEGDIEDFNAIKKAAAFVTSHPGKTTFSPVQSVLDGIPTIIGASIEYHASDEPAVIELKIGVDRKAIVKTTKRWVTATDRNGNSTVIAEGDLVSVSGQTGDIFKGSREVAQSTIEQLFRLLSAAYDEAEVEFGPEEAWQRLAETAFYRDNRETILTILHSPVWKGFQAALKYARAESPFDVLVNVHNTSCVVKARLLASDIQEIDGKLSITANPDDHGVGLMRDERMWTVPEEIDVLRILLLGPDCATPEQYEAVVKEYQSFHGGKYFSAFCADPGNTCVIRTLCMPFSKFLPDSFDTEAFAQRCKLDPERVRKAFLRLAGERETYHGCRGIRLFSIRPDFARLWVTTVLTALKKAHDTGRSSRIRFLLATLTIPEEAKLFVDLLEEVAEEIFGANADWPVDGVAVMLETSGAYICLEQILEEKGGRIEVNGGLIGTNDFTTACLNMNRSDAPRHLIPSYVERGLFEASPFKHVYVPVVGRAMHSGLQRSTALGLRNGRDYFWGLAGELTTDWRSVRWLASNLAPAGLNYISTSPETIVAALFAAATAVRQATDRSIAA